MIYPAGPHFISKLHASLSDDLLTCVCRAWDANRKPFILIPVIHPLIRQNALLDSHLTALKTLQSVVVFESNLLIQIVFELNSFVTSHFSSNNVATQNLISQHDSLNQEMNQNETESENAIWIGEILECEDETETDTDSEIELVERNCNVNYC
jgi:hypothetical protein